MWAPSNRKRSKHWNHVKLIPLHRVNAIWRSSLTLKNQHFSMSPITNFKLFKWRVFRIGSFLIQCDFQRKWKTRKNEKWVEKCQLFNRCVEHRKNYDGKMNEFIWIVSLKWCLCRAVKIKLKFPNEAMQLIFVNLCDLLLDVQCTDCQVSWT